MATVSQISVQFIAYTDRLKRGIEDALKQLNRVRQANASAARSFTLPSFGAGFKTMLRGFADFLPLLGAVKTGFIELLRLAGSLGAAGALIARGLGAGLGAAFRRLRGGRLIRPFLDLGRLGIELGKELLEKIGQGVASAAGGLGTLFGPLMAQLGTELAFLGRIGKNLWGKILGGGGNLLSAIGTPINSLAGILGDLFGRAINLSRTRWGRIIGRALSDSFKAAGPFLNQAWNTAVTGLARARTFAGPIAGRVIGGLGIAGRGVGRIAGGGAQMFVGVAGRVGSAALALTKFAGVLGIVVSLLGGAVVGAALGAAGAFAAFLASAIRSAAEVSRMANEFGITAASMQVLESAAARFGLQTSTMERLLARLAANLGAVKNGTHEAIINFRMIGLAGNQLASMPIDEAFFQIIDHLRSLPTLADKARVSYILFGRDFRKILRLVNDPLMNRKQITQQLGQAGLLQTPEQAMQVERAAQAMTRLTELFQGFRTQLAVKLAPLVELIGNGIADWAGKGKGMEGFVQSMIEGLRDMIALILDVGKTIASSFMQAIGVVLQTAGKAVAGLAMMLAKIGSLPFPGAGDVKNVAEGLGTSAIDLVKAGSHAEAMGKNIGATTPGADFKKFFDAQMAKTQTPMVTAAATGFVLGGPIGAAAGAIQQMAGAAERAGAGLHNFEGRIQKMLDATGRFRERPMVEQLQEQLDFFKKLGPQGGANALPGAAAKAAMGALMGGAPGAIAGLGDALNNNGFISGDNQARGLLKMLEEMEGKLHVTTASPAGIDIRSSQAGELAAQLHNNAPLPAQERVARDIAAMKALDADRTTYARDVRNALINLQQVDKF